MWHLIAHFDGKIYDLGAGFDNTHCVLMRNAYMSYTQHTKAKIEFILICSFNLRPYASQLDFIKDYKTKHFMNAQLETPDVSARFDD